MARQLKPQVVDEVQSPGGHVRIPIYLDRNELDFFVEPLGGGDRLRAGSVHEIKQLAKEMLATAVPYHWEGIIVVEPKEPWNNNNHSNHRFTLGTRVEFTFTRWERSPHPTDRKKFVYRVHTLDFESTEPSDWERKNRERNEDLRRTHVWVDAEHDVVLPYDDETWDGLCALKRAVDAAQAQLATLLQRDDLSAKLRLVGRQPPMPILPEAVAVGDKRRR